MVEIQSTDATSPTSPRILIVGNAGQLGRELESIFAGVGPIVAVDRESVDLADADQTRALVRRAEPDIILNAAAYTAVDRAESEPEIAHAINAQAPRVLAEEARERDALLVHYSTDYVFDGSKAGPWVETDTPNPLNVYGASKLAGEQAVEKVGGKFLIFRTSWVYAPEGKNFVLTMLRLGRERESINVVDDQVGAPTTAAELARAAHAIVGGIRQLSFGSGDEWAGVYHMTCAGSVSWCGFAHAIFERATALFNARAPKVNPITTSEYPTPATRPLNSVLSNDRLDHQFGVRLAPWESALDQVLSEISSQPRS